MSISTIIVFNLYYILGQTGDFGSMNTGQMLLTIGAMILLATLILRVNSNISATTDTVYDSKFVILATSLGNSILEEASDKAFDEATAANSVSKLTDLTIPVKLGKESGESYPNFNDVDDYNGYEKIDSTLPSAVFKADCSVDYVLPNSPDVESHIRTWTKRITVTVTSVSMPDTVRLSSLYSYWVFR